MAAFPPNNDVNNSGSEETEARRIQNNPEFGNKI